MNNKFSYTVTIEKTLKRKEADIIYNHMKTHKDTKKYSILGGFGFSFVNFYAGQDVNRYFSLREINIMLKSLEYPLETDLKIKEDIVKKLYNWGNAINNEIIRLNND